MDTYTTTKHFTDILTKLSSNDPTLTTLNLWNNNIGPDGAASLAIALQNNTTLTTLNLRNNPIGDVGAASLAIEKRLNRNKNLPDRIATHITPALRAMKYLVSPRHSSFLPEELHTKIGVDFFQQVLLGGTLDY